MLAIFLMPVLSGMLHLQAVSAQEAYDSLHRRLDKAKTASYTVLKVTGNNWDYEQDYIRARPFKVAGHGHGLNFTTDGVRTCQDDNLGKFNRPYRPADSGAPVGFESFIDHPPKVIGIGDLFETSMFSKPCLAMKLQIREQNYILYLDKDTRLPCGSVSLSSLDSKYDLPYSYSNVSLDKPQNPSAYKISYPPLDVFAISRLVSTTSPLRSQMCRLTVRDSPYSPSIRSREETLGKILFEWPWKETLSIPIRNNVEPQLTEFETIKHRVCIWIGREDKKSHNRVDLYIDSDTYEPVGYKVTINKESKFIEIVRE